MRNPVTILRTLFGAAALVALAGCEELDPAEAEAQRRAEATLVVAGASPDASAPIVMSGSSWALPGPPSATGVQ
jgi:hypothetical protein